ncbi:MAG TPA: pyridoxamine 5'-phosphate oxidase family protein [Acidimicrobiales bacterium]|nr:pyridoxamine 5'-phosphate oxidase family protein [Acidimicrobiales bacterium]
MSDPPPDADIDAVVTGADLAAGAGGLDELTADECRRLLADNDLGRVAFAAEGRAHIFPVNYSSSGEAVVFRTSPGLKLDAMPLGRVAFEIDGIDRGAGRAWSVVVQGVAHDITDALDDASQELRSATVVPLAPGERMHWIQIRADEVTGRSFRLAPPA